MSEDSADLSGVPWDPKRRQTAHRTLLKSSLRRLLSDFPEGRLDARRAREARIIEGDLRRALGLGPEDEVSAAPAADEIPASSVLSLATSPWSGLYIEAPAVFNAEHPSSRPQDLIAWAEGLDALLEAGAFLSASPSELAAAVNYPLPRFVLDLVIEDVRQLGEAASRGGQQDALFGPRLEAIRRLPGPETDPAELRGSMEWRAPRLMGAQLLSLKETLTEIRERMPPTPAPRPLSMSGSEEVPKLDPAWMEALRHAAGPKVDPTALVVLSRIEIERLSLRIGELFGIEPTDPDAPGALSSLMRAIQNRDVMPPGSDEPARHPLDLWDPAIDGLEAIIVDAPAIVAESRTARSFERPHGRWSPFVRGDLLPPEDPLARPSLFLAARERDPISPAWLRDAEAWRYGVPGHAVVDAFRRAAATTESPYLLMSEREAFSEGWALYAMTEASEAGILRETDRGFGRLAQELIAFVALATDIGVHADGWTTTQAVEFVTEATPLPGNAARDLVARVYSMPGRAALPAIGLLRLRALRRGIRKTLGDAFDAREYHRALLEGGPLPMGEVDHRIEEWLNGLPPSDED